MGYKPNIYPIYKHVITHLSTIDPNFRPRTSKVVTWSAVKSCHKNPPKVEGRNGSPENSTLGIGDTVLGDSFWKPSFLGSVLNLGSVYLFGFFLDSFWKPSQGCNLWNSLTLQQKEGHPILRNCHDVYFLGLIWVGWKVVTEIQQMFNWI